MNNSFGENMVVHWLRRVRDLYVGEFSTNKLLVPTVMVHGHSISKKKGKCMDMPDVKVFKDCSC